MNSRLQATVVRRPSLPITVDDERRLDVLKSSPEQREALSRLIEVPLAAGTVSESALLHAVFEAGLGAVSSAVEEAGYAMIARSAADNARDRKSQARRRPPTWAHEE